MNYKTTALSAAFLLAFGVSGCDQQNTTNTADAETPAVEQKVQITYPETKKVDVVDEYFGVKVEDPYRWLEDDMSAETAEWVKAQNKTTYSYLEQIPYLSLIHI